MRRLSVILANVDMRFFTFPLLLKASAEHGVLGPYVVFGPEVGFNTRATASGIAEGRRLEVDVPDQKGDTVFGITNLDHGFEERGAGRARILAVLAAVRRAPRTRSRIGRHAEDTRHFNT